MEKFFISLFDKLPTAIQRIVPLLPAGLFGWIKKDVLKSFLGYLKNWLCNKVLKPIKNKFEEKIITIANQEITKRVDEIKEEVCDFRKLEELKHEKEKEILKINHEYKIREEEHRYELATKNDVDKDLRNAAFSKAKGELTTEAYESYKAETLMRKYEQSKIIISAETGVDSQLEFDDYETLVQTAKKLMECGPRTKFLLRKAVESLNNDKNSISLSTIKLIDSFSDKDVEKISELLRYMWSNCVVYFEGINQFLEGKGLCQPKTDNIDYLGKIFSNQRGVFADKSFKQDLTSVKITDLFFWKERISNLNLNSVPFNETTLESWLETEENKNQMNLFRQGYKTLLLQNNAFKIETSKLPNDVNDKISIEIEAFAILTKEGGEIFDLLKSDLEPMPEDYFLQIKNYLENKYRQHQIEIIRN